MKVIVLLAALSLFATDTSEDKFVPPNLEHVGLMACAVGGNADATVDTFIVVKYGDGTKDFRPLIARTDNAYAGVEECIKWFKEVQKGLEAAQKRRDAERKQ